jgi:hypothetical protein
MFNMSVVPTLVFGSLAAGKRRQAQATADKNDTQNIPEQDSLSRDDGRVISSIPVSFFMMVY